ncbi:MAG: hypothetical protein WD334_12660 [Chitinophagales bacterium]
MKKLLFLIAAVFFLANALNAQVLKELPVEKEDYLKELENYMKATKRDDCKEVTEIFLENIELGKISDADIDKIIVTNNLMLEKAMRAYPHFHDYLKTVNMLFLSEGNQNKFDDWTKVLNQIIESARRGSSKDFSAYIEFSQAFFSGQYLYESRGKSWKITSRDIQLRYDSVPIVIVSSPVDLIGLSSNDTVIIENTKGHYLPLEQMWFGNGGRADWSKHGMDKNTVYVVLEKYNFELSKSDLTVHDVEFYNKEYFDFPLKGVYENRLLTSVTTATYPKFTSYRKDLTIKNLGENIRYLGGYALEGKQIVAAGSDTSKVQLLFIDANGKKSVSLKSDRFLIKPGDEYVSDDAEVSVYLGGDSIYHPGLSAKYRIEINELSLYRGNTGYSKTPFFDSYHNHEIVADVLVWKLDEPTIDLKMMTGAGKSPAVFTSANFFQKGELEKFQGIADYNPISELKMYAERNGIREFYADEFAKSINHNYSENTIRRQLYKMVEEGYIHYDDATGIIKVKDKVFNYVFANAGLRDYDKIRIASFSSKTNAQINLETSDIDMEGVSIITIADSQNVYLFPKDKKATLKKNQDIAFSGTTFAGRLDFIGEGFYFNYDSFKVDLTNLASATVNIPTGEKDKDGDEIFKPMKSRIEGLTGYMIIDEPDNKSGKDRNPEYPIFVNQDVSFVYYDKASIYDSTYRRSDFYFELEPFEFDSLNTFDAYMSNLHGKLVSADIFPDFEEKLHVQKDLSFGFTRGTPKEGFPLYKNKATYYDSIHLSDKGLIGKGKVDYLFTSFSSDSILFTPDSMNTIADTFHMEQSEHQGVTFPLVSAKGNFIHWLPYKDSMFLKSLETPFKMYEEGATLEGNLLFTLKGLKGAGEFEFNEAALTSEQFAFQSQSLFSDTTDMQIKSLGGEEGVTFETPNVRADIDFEKRFGEFKSNDEGIPTQFTNNQFRTAINEFTWDMEANILVFSAPAGSPGSEFISTHPEQDSLSFLVKTATFDMSQSTIALEGVPEIRVADVSIVPDSNKAKIMPGGKLDTLRNATVHIDTSNNFHKIYEADIVVNGRLDYKGKGLVDYQYPDSEPQAILLDNIYVTKEEQRRKTFYKTKAEGLIEETDSFLLDEMLEYQGKVFLNSERKSLEFEGLTRLSISDTSLKTDWFAFKDTIDPESIFIHYDHMKNPQGDTLLSGLYYNAGDTAGIKTYLSSPGASPDDHTIIQANGALQYGHDKMAVYFGNEAKLLGKQRDGNIVRYFEKEKKVEAEGTFDFGLKTPPINIKSAGKAVNDLEERTYLFYSLLALELPIDKELIETFAGDVNAFSFDRPDNNYIDEEFYNTISEFVKDNNQKSFIENIEKTGQFEKPKDLSNYTIVFSNIELIWDPELRIYRSTGTLELAYAGDLAINKELKGFVELGLRQNNDFFNIYIESTFDDWYHFAYKNKTLQIGTSSKDFNTLLGAISPEKRTSKLDGDEFFFYTLGTYGNMQSFVYRMRMIEEGTFSDSMFTMPEPPTVEEEMEQIKQQLLEEEEKGNVVMPGSDEKEEKKKSKKGDEPLDPISEAIKKQKEKEALEQKKSILEQLKEEEEKLNEKEGKKEEAPDAPVEPEEAIEQEPEKEKVPEEEPVPESEESSKKKKQKEEMPAEPEKEMTPENSSANDEMETNEPELEEEPAKEETPVEEETSEEEQIHEQEESSKKKKQKAEKPEESEKEMAHEESSTDEEAETDEPELEEEAAKGQTPVEESGSEPEESDEKKRETNPEESAIEESTEVDPNNDEETTEPEKDKKSKKERKNKDQEEEE